MHDGLRKYIDIRGLVFDLVVVAFTAFVLGRINPEGKKLVEVLQPWGIFALGLGICFVVTLYLGILYRQYDEQLESPAFRGLMKFVFFLGITGAYLALVLFFAAYRIMPWSGIAREMDIMIVLIPVFPLTWGLQCVFDYDELKEMLYVLYIPLTVAVPLVPISGCVIGSHSGWYAGLAAFFLFIAGSALPYAVRWAFTKTMGRGARDRIVEFREKNMSPAEIDEAMERDAHEVPLPARVLRQAFTQFLVPAATALALLFWQNMTVEMIRQAYANWKLVAGANVLILSLMLSGIVPIRVLSQLAPPFRPVNTAMAAAALAYYIFSLLRMA